VTALAPNKATRLRFDPLPPTNFSPQPASCGNNNGNQMDLIDFSTKRKRVGGRRSRDKGNRAERALVRFLQERGFAAEKISGMYRPGADISVPVLGRDWRIEVKARAAGFSTLYRYLQNRDALVIKADHERWLLVVPLLDAIPIMKRAENKK
jgi:hypothetical protein